MARFRNEWVETIAVLTAAVGFALLVIAYVMGSA